MVRMIRLLIMVPRQVFRGSPFAEGVCAMSTCQGKRKFEGEGGDVGTVPQAYIDNFDKDFILQTVFFKALLLKLQIKRLLN